MTDTELKLIPASKGPRRAAKIWGRQPREYPGLGSAGLRAPKSTAASGAMAKPAPAASNIGTDGQVPESPRQVTPDRFIEPLMTRSCHEVGDPRTSED